MSRRWFKNTTLYYAWLHTHSHTNTYDLHAILPFSLNVSGRITRQLVPVKDTAIAIITIITIRRNRRTVYRYFRFYFHVRVLESSRKKRSRFIYETLVDTISRYEKIDASLNASKNEFGRFRVLFSVGFLFNFFVFCFFRNQVKVLDRVIRNNHNNTRWHGADPL